ncbi:MAG: YihY/virulence factor BrkB family protein, partial [Chloroflexota bacterium]
QMVNLLGGVSNQLTEPVRDELAAILETRQPGILSLGIVGTFWVATTGMSAIIMAMNRAYQVEETRPFWKRYLLALGLTLLAGVALAGAFVLLVVGEFLGRQIAGALGLQTVYQVAVTLARWPVAIVLLLLAMAFLYRAAPNVDLPWKWVAPGAVVFTAGWVLVTVLLSVYIANFGSYNATYGTLGGVVALLIWFYLTGFILLLGAELNAFLDEQADRLGLDEQRRQMRAQAPPEHGDTARGEDGQLAA